MRKNTEVTFGFEAEWQTNANRLNSSLYRAGRSQTHELHPWHCECEACDPFSGADFYGQTDSSCSGEIISRVCAFEESVSAGRYVPSVGDLFTALSQSAYEVDAQPGASSGFHVHVGVDHLSANERAQNLAAFARWESVLLDVSAGAFASNRGYNTTVTSGVIGGEALAVVEAASAASAIETLLTQPSPQRTRMLENALDAHYYSDRHSNLNTRTGHGTWEYRLWNSTRAPWRMELFVRLSIALIDPRITGWMASATKGVPALRKRGRPRGGAHPTAWSLPAMDRLACHLYTNGHEQAAVLLDRQRSYREGLGWERRNGLPLAHN